MSERLSPGRPAPSTPAVRVQMRRLGRIVARAWLERHGWMQDEHGCWWHPLWTDTEVVSRTEAFRRQNAILHRERAEATA